MHLPIWLRNTLLDLRDRARLLPVTRIDCDTTNLRAVEPEWVVRALEDRAVAAEWPAVEGEIGAMGITAAAGGVNPGDRRALYHLVRALRPARVLEVGTHIGASTAHIAAALRTNGIPTAELTTVDLMSVNDPAARPWERYGASFAPAEVMRQMGVGSRVSFVTSSSLEYLKRREPNFDLIFLDGDHAAATVYRELPAAIGRLNPRGVVLLHDYYPGGRPLWSNGVVISGPWLGTERLRREGARLHMHPLGALPWPTKLGSRVTSLAVVMRTT